MARLADSSSLWRLDAVAPSATSHVHTMTGSGATPRSVRTGRLLLAVAVVAGLVFGAQAITNEGAVSTHGDMPRYAMNGVFLYDMIASPAVWRSADLIGEAQRYFARYPALSLGHHPPLLPILLVPFYAVFGVSIFSARLAILASFFVAIIALYAVARRLYGPVPAGWTSLLFATNPFMIFYGQQVMSEMSMVALVLVSLALLLRFCDTGRPRDFVLFVLAAGASLAARQLAVFLVPLYGLILLTQTPPARLLQRPVALILAAGVVFAVVVTVLTVLFAPFNVEVLFTLLGKAVHDMSLPFAWSVLEPIFRPQTASAMAVGVVAVVVAAVRRDRRVVLSLAWITIVLLCVLMLASAEPARYSIAAVPAFSLLAGSLAAVGGSRLREVAMGLLVIAIGSQVWQAVDVRQTGAEGYEAAARYVVARGNAPTVLYSASVDTGYFVFFVRKHDPARRLIVLRSDKLLTTSLMGWLESERRIASPDEIYPLLRTYGTRFVVLEDRPSGSRVLDWLREEVKSDRFAERQRIPIVSRDQRLQNVSLIVYEYLDAGPPAPDAAVDMHLPIVGRKFEIRLSDLLVP